MKLNFAQSGQRVAGLGRFLFVFFIFAMQLPVYGQVAEEIEALLSTPAVTYAQAVRFILEASSEETVFTNSTQAFRYAMEQDWLPKNAVAEATIRLDEISFLIMNAFNMKGGIMYSITKSPHYAYRELVYRSVIQGKTYPSMDVSGDLMLFITSRILGNREKELEIAARRRARETAVRREALAAEISAVLVEQEVADTTVEVTNEGVMITLSDIQFMADSTVLPESERIKLQEIANILRNMPNIKLLVSGHTALAGTTTGRNLISLQRAQAVANYLVSLRACEAGNITALGFGADRPIADNTTEQGMAANRRVEITILE